MISYRWRFYVPLVTLSICLLSPLSDSKEPKELHCFTNVKYTPKSFYESKDIFIVYLKRVQISEWQLCVGNGRKHLKNECAKIDYGAKNAGAKNIRIFLLAQNKIYVARKKHGEIVYSTFDGSGEGDFKESDIRKNSDANDLFDLTLSERGLYNSRDCRMVYPETSHGQTVDSCCKIEKKNEYCLYDVGRSLFEKVEKTKDDQLSIFVYKCNYYYAGVKERSTSGKIYVSHMPTFVDYNQLHCFVGTDDTTQFMMTDADISSSAKQCEDIDIAKLKIDVKAQEEVTLPPDRPADSELEGDIYECMSRWDFLTTASVDACLIGVVLIVIVLAQLGVAEKNRGRVRAKWYRRRPRMRRRHRRYGKKDMTTTEVSQMTNASTLTGMSVMTGASQYTNGTSYYK